MDAVTSWGVSHTLGMMTALSSLMGVVILMYRFMEPLVLPFGEKDDIRYMPVRGVGYTFGRWMIYAIGIPSGSLAFNWVLFKLLVQSGAMSSLWLVTGLDADLGFVHPPSFILAALAFLGFVLAMIVCDVLITIYWHTVELLSDLLQQLTGITVRLVGLFIAWRRLKRAGA